MSIHLDSEDDRRNKLADQILKDLLEINKLQGACKRFCVTAIN